MNRWIVLAISLVLMGVWVGVPLLGRVPDEASVRLFAGLALGAFAIGYIPQGNLVETSEPVRLWRRFAALVIDLSALYMILDPVLRPLAFVWGALIGIGLVFSWFWLQAQAGRATLGQTVMGYRIVPMEGANGEPEFAFRAIMGFVGLCLWPVTFIAASQKDATPGTYFWDRQSNTQAVSVVGLGQGPIIRV